MKVLHVTPEAPGNNSGGKLGVLQTALSLTATADVDYVGPKMAHNITKLEYSRRFFLNATSNPWKMVLAVLSGVINKRYFAWRSWVRRTNLKDYDVLFLDFTKLDFVSRSFKKVNGNAKVVVRVHNVETDYSRVELASKRSGKNFLIFLLSKRQEKYFSKYADRLIFLTEQDRKRFSFLYPHDSSKDSIIPVCLCEKAERKVKQVTDNSILLTGSLWFGPNEDGVAWFLEKVKPMLHQRCNITVAGYHPTKRLVEKCLNNGVRLIESPDDMTQLFEETDIVAIPIFGGAGMKVKLAEALSYGKPVVSTSFGAIGYKIEHGVNSFIADDAICFAECIDKYFEMTSEERMHIQVNSFALFKDYYCMDRSIEHYCRLLDELKGKTTDEMEK